MANGPGRVEPFRTHADTVHDAVTTEQAEGVVQIGQTLFRGVVAAIRQEAVALQQRRRTQELLRVPPEAGAAGGVCPCLYSKAYC